MKNKKLLLPIIIFTSVLLLGMLVVFNLQTIDDLIKSSSFKPTERFLELEKNLALTEYGSRVLRASSPNLTTDGEYILSICNDKSDDSSDYTIRGCFYLDKIYVYDVNSEEIPGITESTLAHELLHAVWARLSASEKTRLTKILIDLKESAPEEFRNTIDLYDDDQKIEETYVRSATQLKTLPEDLEKHFETIFRDQDFVENYYETYITPFRVLTTNLDVLKSKIGNLKTEIETEMSVYNPRFDALESSINEFNSCANTPDCFDYNTFNIRYEELQAESDAVEAQRNSLNDKINSYNSMIEEYNSSVVKINNLESITNPRERKQNEQN